MTASHSELDDARGEPAAFTNSYADERRAAAYARLAFPGTYYLAFRDIPAIIGSLPHEATALDFGCGAGRSSRFLRGLGLDVVGVDISEQMLAQARAADPDGDYRLVRDDAPIAVPDSSFDLILCAFTFDNIPGWDRKEALFRDLRRMLRPNGRVLNLVSSPLLYVNEWASFSTRRFAQNFVARTGDIVRTIILDVDDHRPVDDIFWTEADYRAVYGRAGLAVRQVHRPLGRASDGVQWVTETEVPPWTIYELIASEAA